MSSVIILVIFKSSIHLCEVKKFLSFPSIVNEMKHQSLEQQVKTTTCFLFFIKKQDVLVLWKVELLFWPLFLSCRHHHYSLLTSLSMIVIRIPKQSFCTGRKYQNDFAACFIRPSSNRKHIGSLFLRDSLDIILQFLLRTDSFLVLD